MASARIALAIELCVTLIPLVLALRAGILPMFGLITPRFALSTQLPDVLRWVETGGFA